MAKRPIAADDVAKRPISSHRYKALKSCSNMQWYECWHSEGVAPQFTKPPFFPLEEKGGYLLLHHWNVNSLKSWQLIEETS